MDTLQLAAALRRFEVRFLLPTGAIDLLAMANTVGPEVFREYINGSRELRARTRKK